MQQAWVYNNVIYNNGSATASSHNGLAKVVGQSGTGRIAKGEVLTVPCQAQGNSGAVLSRVDADQAGTTLDNYYHFRYPRKYDGRYRNYYTYLDDPNYYDPYRGDVSYQYVS